MNPLHIVIKSGSSNMVLNSNIRHAPGNHSHGETRKDLL